MLEVGGVYLIIFVIIVIVIIVSTTKDNGNHIPQTSKSIYDDEYQALLYSKEWRMKREIILKRDNYECQFCHRGDKPLHVHHKYYNKYPDGEMVKPWEYDNDVLITLCEDCHKWIHSQKQIKTYYRKRMPWN